jgi:hypothetical protein
MGLSGGTSKHVFAEVLAGRNMKTPTIHVPNGADLTVIPKMVG